MPRGRKKSVVLEIEETSMPVACVNIADYGVVIMALNEASLTSFIKAHVKGYKLGGSPDTEEYDVEVKEMEKVE